MSKNISTILKQLAEPATLVQVKKIINHYMGDDYSPTDDKELFNDFYNSVIVEKKASAPVLRLMIKALPVFMPHFYSGVSETKFYNAQRAYMKANYPASLHTAISKLKMSHVRSKQIKRDYSLSVERKNEDRPERFVSQVFSEINRLANDDSKDRKHSLLSALGLATGARPNEIVMTSEFAKIDDKHFEQTGISREKAGQSHIDTVVRPTMGMTTSNMLSLLSEYRSIWAPYIADKKAKGKSDENIVRLILLQTNRRTADILDLNETVSYWRKVYANTAEALREDKNTERMVWIGRTLGHSPGDSTTALSYSTIRIIDDVTDPKK